MKGYEDIAATLALLVVVLIGGYVYLNSEGIKQQRETMQYPKKHVESKSFEALHKTTEQLYSRQNKARGRESLGLKHI